MVPGLRPVTDIKTFSVTLSLGTSIITFDTATSHLIHATTVAPRLIHTLHYFPAVKPLDIPRKVVTAPVSLTHPDFKCLVHHFTSEDMRLTRAVKNTWRHGIDSTEEDVIERFASLDLLIIDEVGVQFGSPTEMTILQEIINARYESVLPTILISNLTFEQLKESIGERIVDRVTDGGRNRLAFGWESYRAIAAGITA